MGKCYTNGEVTILNSRNPVTSRNSWAAFRSPHTSYTWTACLSKRSLGSDRASTHLLTILHLLYNSYLQINHPFKPAFLKSGASNPGMPGLPGCPTSPAGPCGPAGHLFSSLHTHSAEPWKVDELPPRLRCGG
uniref:Uncharacterized protein n=1 Tax=Meloidogyne incognita TaxID=6306 RepID=A0A914NQ23_MELIC